MSAARTPGNMTKRNVECLPCKPSVIQTGVFMLINPTVTQTTHVINEHEYTAHRVRMLGKCYQPHGELICSMHPAATGPVLPDE